MPTRVEVLVATMNQIDLSLFEKMNIQTDVIFCNQCDRNEFIETEINGCRVRMLSTTTRGVGINRNLAMQLSSAEICLCADDDVVYVDGYEKIICEEFDKFPDANILGFSITRTNYSGKCNFLNKTKKQKRNSIGTARLAYRNKVIKKSNLCFSTLFGGGGIYGSGEDALFLIEARARKLHIYESKEIIANVDYSSSTWFSGYNEKLFFDKGAWCRAAYPIMWRPLKYYLILKFKKKSEFTYNKIIKLMNQGAKAYTKQIGYNEFCNIENCL